MAQNSQSKFLTIGVLVLVVAVVGFFVLNAPDRRGSGEKISDAISELPNGADKAARQLEDRTPGKKLNDAAKDVGNDLKKATNQQ